MLRAIWIWLVELPWLSAFHFEAAEGHQTWNPDLATLADFVKRIEAVQETDAFRAVFKRDKAD